MGPRHESFETIEPSWRRLSGLQIRVIFRDADSRRCGLSGHCWHRDGQRWAALVVVEPLGAGDRVPLGPRLGLTNSACAPGNTQLTIGAAMSFTTFADPVVLCKVSGATA